MKLNSPIGFLLGLGVVGFATTSGIDNPKVFLNEHAAIIVIGGTVSVAFIIFPFKHFMNILKVYFRVITGSNSNQIFLVIDEIMKIAKGQQAGQTLPNLVKEIKNPFLRESVELLAKGGFSEEDLDDVLEKRLQTQNEEYKHNAATYKVLGKFPPAFGLCGATLGMISLLQGLGQPGAFQKLGPSMSVALVATFYGLIMANVFVIPMGENLAEASHEDLIVRRVIVDGVKLVRAKKHPLIVEEFLRSYLKPADRNKLAKT
ncbi:MAG: MotA/TolQ/ExbB proton channel family protein [Bdellovibrionota bacterium]